MFNFIHTLAFTVALWVSLVSVSVPVSAAPVQSRSTSTSIPQVQFTPRSYSEFHISNGFGGTAQAEAFRIFTEPFLDVPLKDVPYSIYEQLSQEWEEVDFAHQVLYETAVDQALEVDDLETADALEVGRAKNDVLRLTVLKQLISIQIAKNRAMSIDTLDQEDSLIDCDAQLFEAILVDEDNFGKKSLAVV